MHPVSPESLPAAIQYVLEAAAALGVFIAGLLGYIKKGKHAAAGSEVAVVSATFADKKLIEALVDALEANTRALRDIGDDHRRNRTAIDDAADAIRASTDASLNMLRFMRRDEA